MFFFSVGPKSIGRPETSTNYMLAEMGVTGSGSQQYVCFTMRLNSAPMRRGWRGVKNPLTPAVTGGG